MIGVATALYLFLTGRYAGISGIMRSVAFGDPDRAMDAVFIAGLVVGGLVWTAFGTQTSYYSPKFLLLPAIGGVLVGFGSALQRGCTSGHGVCGLGRLSLCSFYAVVVFLITGMLTVFAVRHLAGFA